MALQYGAGGTISAPGSKPIKLPASIRGTYTDPSMPQVLPLTNPSSPGYAPYNVPGNSAYTVGANPFAGNIFAGIPTTLAGTPYGAAYAQAQKYNYTPAQMRAVANQQASAQTNAALGASNASSAVEQAQLQAMMNRSGGFAAALGSYGPQYAAAMSQAYNQAANTVAQLGTGVVSSGGATLTAAQQAAQQIASDKTGGQGQVSSYDIPGMTGALTQTGVNIPGNSLAVSGANAAQMGIAGAQQDQDYALNNYNYYQQQATQALAQRTAERAQIIAQKPQLFQSALEAQRQDEYQTQSRSDNLVQAGTSYITSLKGLAVQTAQAQSQWLTGQAALTHINPATGQPMGGYVWADKGHTTIVPFKDLASYKEYTQRTTAMTNHWNDTVDAYNKRTNVEVRAANAKAAAANAPGKFDPKMSAAVHYIADGFGRPIVSSSKDGKPVPYSAPGKQPTALSTMDMLKISGTLSAVATNMKNGLPANAKTGAAAQDPIDIQSAMEKMKALGYFTNPKIAQAAFTALGQAYGLTTAQLLQVDQGIDPATGGAYGVTGAPGTATGYGPPTPAGVGAPGVPNDPKMAPGKAWNAKTDPIKSFIGTSIILTQSGRQVDTTTHKYLATG